MPTLKIPKSFILSFLLYLFINSLFLLKYTSRLGLNQYCIVLVYNILLVLIFIPFFKLKKPEIRFFKIAFWIILLLNCSGIIYFLISVNPYTLRVDRWSAIHNFIQYLFKGEYPYAAKTHCGGYGSPFPVWQIFHIPFYLLGNVGLGMLFSVLLITYILFDFFKTYINVFIFLLLLLLSPGFWYEVTVRSDLIYNFIICLLFIIVLFKKKYVIQSHPLAIAIIFGLLLSTRLTIIIPFSIFLFPGFLNSGSKQKLIFILTSILVFVATFIPFAFWNFNTLFFFKHNPFILQSSQGSWVEIISISALALFLSTKWKNNLTLCSTYISISIFGLVFLTFIHSIIIGIYKIDIVDSAYDISYFNMSLPFIIFTICNLFHQSTGKLIDN